MLREIGQTTAAIQDDFKDLIAMIQPLPENVVPSKRFRDRFRSELLRLNSDGSSRAA